MTEALRSLLSPPAQAVDHRLSDTYNKPDSDLAAANQGHREAHCPWVRIRVQSNVKRRYKRRYRKHRASPKTKLQLGIALGIYGHPLRFNLGLKNPVLQRV